MESPELEFIEFLVEDEIADFSIRIIECIEYADGSFVGVEELDFVFTRDSHVGFLGSDFAPERVVDFGLPF
jgi:hypothetical protein